MGISGTAADAAKARRALQQVFGYGGRSGEDPGAAAGDESADKTVLEALARDLDALMPQLQDIARAHPPLVERLRSTWQDCRAAITGGDATAANRALAELRGLASRLGKPSSATPGAGLSAAPPAEWDAAYKGWLAAKEAIDGQISKLSGLLRQSGREDLVEIAERGLLAMTNDCYVPVQAAFMDFANCAAGDRPAIARDALQKAAALHAQIKSDLRVEACDENPFGVPVSIRTTLGEALVNVGRVLKQAAALP